MVNAQKWIFRNIPPNGPFTESNFELSEEKLRDLQEGEFLLETVYMNLRPSLRGSTVHHQKNGDTVYSDNVAVVTASKNGEYPVGTRLVTHLGWRSHTILNSEKARAKNQVYKNVSFDQTTPLMDMGSLSPSHALGIFGTSGLCAYFSVTEVLNVQPGDVVYVNAAAGGVGSIGGQLAKIKGARVVGSAGSDAKCQWLRQIGFDDAINYKTKNLDAELTRVAPDGFSCFLDVAGGDSTAMVIIKHMKSLGRVCIAGATAYYSKDVVHASLDDMPKTPAIFATLIVKQLRVEGMVMGRWKEKIPEAISNMRMWTEQGKLIAKEHVTEGFENIPKSYVEMMEGKNIGKAVVKVSSKL